MKTVIDIKDDVYNVIKGSALDEEATGKLCKSSKRPANSDKEDIVISVIGNNVSQMQEAFVYVNIYVKDNIRDGEAEINDTRCRELCRLASDLFEVHNGGSFRITLVEQTTPPVNGKDEHFIKNKILYQYCNE